MPKDYFLSPDLDDPVWSEDTVMSLVHRHAPHAAGVKQIEESGGEARTYLIDDDLLLKQQRPHRRRPRTSQARETLFLRTLEGVEGVNVPRVLGHGFTESGGEYTVMTRMPGTAVKHCSFERSVKDVVLRQTGAMLRKIHDHAAGILCASPLFPGDRSPVDALWRMGNLADDIVSEAERAAGAWRFRLPPGEVAHRAMAMLPDMNLFVALHSNPASEHVFADERKGVLTGIIDFGDSYVAHPIHDLFRWIDPADRSALFAGYVAEKDVADAFKTAWRTACILADMRFVTRSREAADAGYAEIEALIDG